MLIIMLSSSVGLCIHEVDIFRRVGVKVTFKETKPETVLDEVEGVEV